MREGALLVAVNGRDVSESSLDDTAMLIRSAALPIVLTLRV